MCRELTKNLLIGINGSIFTYGQTTSGKTYTMLGNPRNPGILPCVLKDLFDLINKEN
jgi:centromeric protein E